MDSIRNYPNNVKLIAGSEGNIKKPPKTKKDTQKKRIH
jgi:hypothetical protein